MATRACSIEVEDPVAVKIGRDHPSHSPPRAPCGRHRARDAGTRQARTVRFRVAAEDLAYWEPSRHGWVVEPGPVELMAGRSSADADLGLRVRVAVAP
jgi:hypothetical protein